MAETQHNGPFSATVDLDETINSTALTLSYTDEAHPERNMLVSVAPEFGSNLFRFRVGDHDIIHCEKTLLQQRDFTGDFVLWPIPNRLRDKRYTFEGHDYQFSALQRPGGDKSLVHGLVYDQVWHYSQPVVHDNAATISTFIEMDSHNPWYHSYPFDSRLGIEYELSQTGLTITYHVQNQGDKDLPFGFALHPYLNLLSGPEDTYVSLAAQKVMEADKDLLPTGRVLDVDTTMYAMFDLTRPVPVGYLKLDHVYADLQPAGEATINYKKHNLQLVITASDDFAHAVVYTPDGPQKQQYFCLEHQTCSTDAFNFYNQGSAHRQMAHVIVLPAGESHQGTLHYTIEHKTL
jgi:aldose 1-epimerase